MKKEFDRKNYAEDACSASYPTTGGVAGCVAGYQARTRIVKALGTRDIYIALLEDFVGITGSLWVVSRF